MMNYLEEAESFNTQYEVNTLSDKDMVIRFAKFLADKYGSENCPPENVRRGEHDLNCPQNPKYGTPQTVTLDMLAPSKPEKQKIEKLDMMLFATSTIKLQEKINELIDDRNDRLNS